MRKQRYTQLHVDLGVDPGDFIPDWLLTEALAGKYGETTRKRAQAYQSVRAVPEKECANV